MILNCANFSRIKSQEPQHSKRFYQFNFPPNDFHFELLLISEHLSEVGEKQFHKLSHKIDARRAT